MPNLSPWIVGGLLGLHVAAQALPAPAPPARNLPMKPFEPETVRDAFRDARRRGLPNDGILLIVSVALQRMAMVEAEKTVRIFVVSTSRKGVGHRENSWMTPPGWHRVAQRFGAGRPAGQVFVARRPVARVLRPDEWRSDADEDRIVSRILWLEGLEPGLNRGQGIDSFARFIYLHGTNQEHRLGTPASNGCIRLANRDMIALFDRVAGRETWCRIDPPPAPTGP